MATFGKWLEENAARLGSVENKIKLTEESLGKEFNEPDTCLIDECASRHNVTSSGEDVLDVCKQDIELLSSCRTLTETSLTNSTKKREKSEDVWRLNSSSGDQDRPILVASDERTEDPESCKYEVIAMTERSSQPCSTPILNDNASSVAHMTDEYYIDLVFRECDVSDSEQVRVSDVMDLIAKNLSREENDLGELKKLWRMFDPDLNNVLVNFTTFNLVMKEWLQQLRAKRDQPEPKSFRTPPLTISTDCNGGQPYQANVGHLHSLTISPADNVGADNSSFEGVTCNGNLSVFDDFDLSNENQQLRYQLLTVLEQKAKSDRLVSVTEEQLHQVTAVGEELRKRLTCLNGVAEKNRVLSKECEELRDSLAFSEEAVSNIRQRVKILEKEKQASQTLNVFLNEELSIMSNRLESLNNAFQENDKVSIQQKDELDQQSALLLTKTAIISDQAMRIAEVEEGLADCKLTVQGLRVEKKELEHQLITCEEAALASNLHRGIGERRLFLKSKSEGKPRFSSESLSPCRDVNWLDLSSVGHSSNRLFLDSARERAVNTSGSSHSIMPSALLSIQAELKPMILDGPSPLCEKSFHWDQEVSQDLPVLSSDEDPLTPIRPYASRRQKFRGAQTDIMIAKGTQTTPERHRVLPVIQPSTLEGISLQMSSLRRHSFLTAGTQGHPDVDSEIKDGSPRSLSRRKRKLNISPAEDLLLIPSYRNPPSVEEKIISTVRSLIPDAHFSAPACNQNAVNVLTAPSLKTICKSPSPSAHAGLEASDIATLQIVGKTGVSKTSKTMSRGKAIVDDNQTRRADLNKRLRFSGIQRSCAIEEDDVNDSSRPPINFHMFPRNPITLMPEPESSETESAKGSMELEPETSTGTSLPISVADDRGAFPNLPDSLLMQLGVHRDSKVESYQSLSEPEIENKFHCLTLAMRSDMFTVERRLELHHRQRELAESNVETELLFLKSSLNLERQFSSDPETLARLTEIQRRIEVLRQASERVSSRAEIYGAVEQEERMARAVEVMIIHVENVVRQSAAMRTQLEDPSRGSNEDPVLEGGRFTHSAETTPKTLTTLVGSSEEVRRRRRASLALITNRSQTQPAISCRESHSASRSTIARGNSVDGYFSSTGPRPSILGTVIAQENGSVRSTKKYPRFRKTSKIKETQTMPNCSPLKSTRTDEVPGNLAIGATSDGEKRVQADKHQQTDPCEVWPRCNRRSPCINFICLLIGMLLLFTFGYFVLPHWPPIIEISDMDQFRRNADFKWMATPPT